MLLLRLFFILLVEAAVDASVSFQNKDKPKPVDFYKAFDAPKQQGTSQNKAMLPDDAFNFAEEYYKGVNKDENDKTSKQSMYTDGDASAIDYGENRLEKEEMAYLRDMHKNTGNMYKIRTDTSPIVYANGSGWNEKANTWPSP